MSVFVDTSALYAVLDADDGKHSPACAEWQRLLLNSSLVTTNYVLVETTALLQHRLGVEAVRNARSTPSIPMLDAHALLQPTAAEMWDRGLASKPTSTAMMVKDKMPEFKSQDDTDRGTE